MALTKSQRTLRLIWALVTVSLVVAGATLLGSAVLTAQQADDERPGKIPFAGFTLATPVPLPDDSGALARDAALVVLSEIPGVGAVLEAAERGDVDALLAATTYESVSCARLIRGALDERCEDADGSLELLFQHDGSAGYWRTDAQMREWLSAIADAAPPTLVLAARDSRNAAVTSSEYYLAFTVAVPAAFDGLELDGFGLHITAGANPPIQSIAFLNADWTALMWVQEFEPEQLVLITPPSLEGWKGQFDYRRESAAD